MTISNPFLRFEVSNGWSSWHQAIDYATPQGTVFTSPADGIYRRRESELRTDIPGQAGHYGDIVLADGRRIRVCHLERHIAADGARVTRGVTRIGATGNTGTSSGPHMHTTGFNADGTRWNWTLEAGATPAGSIGEDMPLTDDDIRRIWAYPVQRTTGPVAAIQELADAKTAAIAAKTAASTHVADWQQGIAGVQNAGRLYVLLARASAAGTDVDEKALALELAPLLTANLRLLPDTEVQRLSKAINDEAARRMTT